VLKGELGWSGWDVWVRGFVHLGGGGSRRVWAEEVVSMEYVG